MGICIYAVSQQSMINPLTSRHYVPNAEMTERKIHALEINTYNDTPWPRLLHLGLMHTAESVIRLSI